jgi:hypothetical protein
MEDKSKNQTQHTARTGLSQRQNMQIQGFTSQVKTINERQVKGAA